MIATKSRTAFLDLLRIVACFFVIVNHTNSDIFLGTTPKSLTWFVSLTYFYISKIAVPIFFMISGYLLLNKNDDYKKTFRRIFRILIVIIVCGFIYAVFRTYYNKPEPSFSDALKRFSKVFSTVPSTALWYLYTYLGILFMLPFLQKMVSLMSRRDYHVFFVISAFFVSILPILKHFFPEVAVNKNFTLPLFGGYICLLLLGNYFSRFEIKKTKLGFLLSCVLFVLMLAFNVVATYFEQQKSDSDYLFFSNRLFFPILLQSVCVFYMASFIKFPEKLAKIISYIGSCTFGIYLLSDMLIDLLEPVYTAAAAHMHRFFAVILLEICIFAAGFIAVSLLKKIPGVKKVL